MKADYRNELFNAYRDNHFVFVEPNDEAKQKWFLAHARKNYLPHLDRFPKEAKIFEIGCNRGLLLAALRANGFQNLSGVDLSPGDISAAQQLLPDAHICCIDALHFLESHRDGFDVIIMKAVLEHIEKDKVLPLLKEISAGLKPDGIAIIDVPNMDWIFAAHERYMDFTHEVGFTRESLGQVMRNVFSSVKIIQGVPVPGEMRLKGRIASVFRNPLIWFLGIAFKIMGEGAGDVWWHNRSLIGIGIK